MSPLYNQKYVLVDATGNDDVDLWNITGRRIEKRFERHSRGFARCAIVALGKQYVIGTDGSMEWCDII
jgi:hypothetical protein